VPLQELSVVGVPQNYSQSPNKPEVKLSTQLIKKYRAKPIIDRNLDLAEVVMSHNQLSRQQFI
jgi:hypothetical protein